MPHICVRVQVGDFAADLVRLCKRTKELKSLAPAVLENVKAIATDPEFSDQILDYWVINQSLWTKSQWKGFAAPNDPDLQFPVIMNSCAGEVCSKLKDILPNHELTEVMAVYVFAEFLCNYVKIGECLSDLEQCLNGDMAYSSDEQYVYFLLQYTPYTERGDLPEYFNMDLEALAAKREILEETFAVEETDQYFFAVNFD